MRIKGRLTDGTVRSLRPRARRYVAYAGGGLSVRVTPAGVRTFVLSYRMAGERRKRQLTLGTYPAMSVAEAHAAAAAARLEVARGRDVGAEAVRSRRAAREAESFAELAEQYLERWARPRKRSWVEDERILRRDVNPRWGRRKAKDITRADVLRLLDALGGHQKVSTNRKLAVIRRLFSWAIEVGLLEASPVVKVRPPAKESRRERCLSLDEAARFLSALPSAAMAPCMRGALAFALATGARMSEALNASWAEIDLSAARWDLPASRSKSSRPIARPLSTLALRVLRDNRTVGSPWCFPSWSTGRPMHIASVSTAVSRNLEHFAKAGIDEPFRAHDLRRSFATGVASLGASRETVRRLLGHTDSSVTSIYDRFEGMPQMVEAVERWGAELERRLDEARRAAGGAS